MSEATRSATVWVGKWLQAQQCTLSLHLGKLRLDSNQACLFDCEIAKADKITWHWYSFSGAFEIQIGGAYYFVSFVPRHSGLGSWQTGLAEGHRWLALMEGSEPPARPALGAKIFTSVVSLIQAFFYGVGGLMVLMQVADESNPMWIRIGAGLMVLCIVYLIIYLLWQAVTAPFRRDT